MGTRLLSLGILLVCSGPIAAAEQNQTTSAPAKIAIIIDDMGYAARDGRFFKLPYPLTFSVLPDSPYGEGLAKDAQQLDKEVMLHLPMQAHTNAATESKELTLAMTPLAMRTTLLQALSKIAPAVGVNNHMGSALTADNEAMFVMMNLLAEQQLYFVDSRTSVDTVAETTAIEMGVPTARRHVFLDHQRDPEAMQKEWQRLVQLAHQQGFAIAIGHPHEVTYQLLEKNLPLLEAANIEVVFASALVR